MASAGVDGGVGGRRALVTGGAGFIGSNLAARLAVGGWRVTVLDNLARHGAERNLDWLRREGGAGAVEFVEADIRDAAAVERALRGADAVFHLAGQTAVTTSVDDPRGDFEANTVGTLNVLEAARAAERPPVVLYASSNKVYGSLDDLDVVERETRFDFAAQPHGVDETRRLEFHSPYACSKGAADAYVLDYHRIYGLRTVVFRQSCIYGRRQLGSAEQGWVAWLLAAAAFGVPITVYGTGKQVRDLLSVEDAVEAYVRAYEAIDRTAGRAYNVGGGRERTVSVWHEFAPLLERVLGRRVEGPRFEPARPGDQRVFYCDTRRAERDFGWRPQVSVEEGLRRLADWVLANPELFVEHAAT